MLKKWQETYLELKDSFQECLASHHDAKQTIACCFAKAEKVWTLVKAEMTAADFDTSSKDLHLFRQVQARFISEVEYYTLLYHAECFLSDDPHDKQQFLTLECQRVELILHQHDSFFKRNRLSKNRYRHWFRLDENEVVENAGKLIAFERYYKFLQSRKIAETDKNENNDRAADGIGQQPL